MIYLILIIINFKFRFLNYEYIFRNKKIFKLINNYNNKHFIKDLLYLEDDKNFNVDLLDVEVKHLTSSFMQLFMNDSDNN